MSFLSKALRRAEVFLEQVDESVAQASRRMVVEGATGDVDEDDSWLQSGGDPLATAGLDAGVDPVGHAGQEGTPLQPPKQRRRGLANIKRAERSSIVGSADDLKSFATPQLEKEKAYAPSPQRPSEPQSNLRVATSESAKGVADDAAKVESDDWQEADASGWGDFDFPDNEPEAVAAEDQAGSVKELPSKPSDGGGDPLRLNSGQRDDPAAGFSAANPSVYPTDAPSRAQAGPISGATEPKVTASGDAEVSPAGIRETKTSEPAVLEPDSKPEPGSAPKPLAPAASPKTGVQMIGGAGNEPVAETKTSSLPPSITDFSKDSSPAISPPAAPGPGVALNETADGDGGNRLPDLRIPVADESTTAAVCSGQGIPPVSLSPLRPQDPPGSRRFEAPQKSSLASDLPTGPQNTSRTTTAIDQERNTAISEAVSAASGHKNIEAEDSDVDPEDFAAVIHENDELRKELEFAEEDFADMLKEKAKLVSNLKRLKEVVSEMEESLEEKSAEVRRLGEAVVDLRDSKSKLSQQLKESVAKGKDSMDLLRKELSSEIAALRKDLQETSAERDELASENSRVKDAMAQGREVDMATADDARDLASRAESAFEDEVAAHRKTREALKLKQEALDAESAVTAEALSSMQRKTDDAISGASSAREAQRKAESNLGRVASARDAALARVEDLTNELASYKAADDGELPGREELASLRQTVSELENALEAKNVELTRLEGEVENMRSILEMRHDSAVARSPGSARSGGYEVEQKLRHMADSALRKQAQLEVLRSENKVLQSQLDTERKRTREAQAMAAVATSSRHTLRGGFRGILDAGDEERGERPSGVREGPMARFRSPRGWPATLSKFVASLDVVSAQILSFLRKEPLVRMALVVYIALMHVLVYGLLHYHVESTLGSDMEGGIHAHPHGPIVPDSEQGQPRIA